METNSLKNIIVLKSLPSNIIDEAIIILKSNKYAKKFQTIEKNNKEAFAKTDLIKKEYIVKEAEALLAGYVKEVENRNQFNKNNQEIKKKYRILKKYSIAITILFCISTIILFV